MSDAVHWTVVREVISSTNTGAQVMSALPGLVRRLLDEEAWRSFTTPEGETQRYERFTEFVEAEPPRGLGGRVSQLIALCGTEAALADRVMVLVRQEISPTNPVGTNRHSRDRATASRHTDSAEHITARLKRDDPEAAEKVVRGETTANAVAREKGWRKPRVVLSSPASVALRLREHFTPEQLAELIALLLDQS